jgi:hypothetical protein
MRPGVAVVGGLLLLPTALLAQDPLVTVGTRVRLTTHQPAGPDSGKTEELQGTVSGWRGDTLVLRVHKGLLTAVPSGTVSRLLVPGGRAPDPLGGAAKGMAVGAGVGFAVLGALCGEEDIDPGPGEGGKSSCTFSDLGVLLLGTAALTVAGGVTGLVVGTVVGAERWRPVAMPRARLSVRPLPGGAVGVGLALRF